MKNLFLLILLALPIAKEEGTCYVRPSIVFKIAKREGFYKEGTLPQRLHNPGALKFRRQLGATKGERGFAKFKSDEAGWNALDRQVHKYLSEKKPLKTGWDYL